MRRADFEPSRLHFALSRCIGGLLARHMTPETDPALRIVGNDDHEQSAVESQIVSVLFAVTTATYVASLTQQAASGASTAATWVAAFLLSPFLWTVLLAVTALFGRFIPGGPAAIQRFQARIALILFFAATVYCANQETFARGLAYAWLVTFALNLIAAIGLRLFAKTEAA